MSEWIHTELKNLTTKIGSGATPRGGQEAYKSEGISLIRSQNILDFSFSTNGLAFIDDEQARQLQNVEIKEKDVLINITGDYVARVCMVPSETLPARVNQHVAILRADTKKLDPDYLLYYLLNPVIKRHLLRLSSDGATRNALTKANLEELIISAPKDINQQREISEKIKLFDSKISLLRQQNQTLEELAQTLFKRWFVDFEFPNENGQPYKSSGGKMIDSELGEIPEGWKLKPLDELVIVHNGYSYKGSELQESDVAMVTLKNFDRNGGFRFDGFKEIVSSNYKEKHIVQVGDLVVAHTDLTQDAEVLGNPAIIMKNDKYRELIISMDLVKVESQDPNINSEFLYFLMAEKRFKSHCKGYSNGTTVLHLSKNAIPEYLFPMPISSDTIVLFSNYAKTVYAKIIKNISEIQNVTNLRDTLLPKLMSGEIEIN
jgi:type I restriction enzyme S subunit